MKEENKTFVTDILSWLSVPPKRQHNFIVWLIIYWILVTAIIVIDPKQMLDEIAIGKPVPKTIICPKDLTITDHRETESLRAKASDNEPSVYKTDSHANEVMLEDFDKNLRKLNDFYDTYHDKANKKSINQIIRELFPEKFLLDSRELSQLSTLSVSQFDELKNKSRIKFTELCSKQITEQNFNDIKRDIYGSADSLWEAGQVFKHLFVAILEGSIRINSVLDVEMTSRRKKEASDGVQPVEKHFQKGQRIIAEGDIVTEDTFAIFKQIQQELQKNVFLSMIGSMLLMFIVIVMAIAYIRVQDINVFVDDVQYKLIATLCFVCLLATKVVFGISDDYHLYYLLILLSPMATLVLLLISTMSNLKIVYFCVFWIGVLTFIVTLGCDPFIVGLMVALIIGAIGGILNWDIFYKDKEGNLRSILRKTGLNIGVCTMGAVFAVMLINSSDFSIEGLKKVLIYACCGLFNGMASGILSNGLLPYIEDYFSFATPTKLLELTSEESPLLKRLAQEAPGTFQHSKAVANMASQAAAAVDADPLLTKVCALYHDIGKIKRPEYYTENQHGENPHDEKKPTMSALIIATHVKDGAELARDYKIPHRVIEVMTQHHGTSLIEYFYNKQKELTPDTVDESQFRYKSLKPQSKEAAILLLADAVEASSRSLDELNPEKIKAHVKKIVDHKMKDDNQLEETNLTLKDIDTIEDEFVKVLISANHKRIKYQNQLKEEAAAKAAAAKAEAEAVKAEAAKIEAENKLKEDLKNEAASTDTPTPSSASSSEQISASTSTSESDSANKHENEKGS